VNFRAHIIPLVLLVTPATAAWQDEIGFARLKLLAGAELPTAPGQGFSQIEAPEGGSNYTPNQTDVLFSGKSFTVKSGTSAVSNHANHVGINFYGTTSQQPGGALVDLYEVNDWLGSGFLNVNTSAEPEVELRDVQNHSWVGSTGLTSLDIETGKRLDFAINRDGFVCVVGLHNDAAINPLPGLLGQTYNTISVGRDDGNHSRGPTTLEVAGRVKPDIVAPSAAPEYATSWTTPMVAGSAGLLFAKLGEIPISLAVTDRPRVVKALLLASATKNTVPGWFNNLPASPLDPIYGAGELNIHHAYSTVVIDRAIASNSTQYKHRGWAAESVSNNSEKHYFFNIPAGAPSTPFCAALTWHRLSAKSGSNTWSHSLTNLSLRLHNASGFTLGSQIALSDSGVDNVELIYQATLPPGNYALVVDNPPSSTTTPYALAWHSLPGATVAATVSTAREIDGQAGQVTFTRSGDTTLPLLVPLAVSGTAVSGTHFQALPASVTIPAGQTSAAVSVTPIADSLAQGNRTVIVAVAADFALVRDAAQTATVTIQDKPFDAWRFANFTPPELANPSISGETADPDADQLANLLEYALGLAPKSPGISPVATIDLNGYLALSVTKNPAASDVAWSAQVTDDFSAWQAAVTTVNTADTFTARDNVLMNATERRFIRLKITR
jgi:hypothetical protein